MTSDELGRHGQACCQQFFSKIWYYFEDFCTETVLFLLTLPACAFCFEMSFEECFVGD